MLSPQYFLIIQQKNFGIEKLVVCTVPVVKRNQMLIKLPYSYNYFTLTTNTTAEFLQLNNNTIN